MPPAAELDRLKRSALFLQRDGVLNVERAPWLTSWADWEWVSGAVEALGFLTTRRPPHASMGLKAFERGPLTTNQLQLLLDLQRQAVRMKKHLGWGDPGMAPAPWLVVVTNQSGVGRGKVAQEVVEEIHAAMRVSLARMGLVLAGVESCYHAPEDGCICRIPQPELILGAARRLGVDLARSFTIGESRRYLEAGAAAGTRTVLVKTGRGAEAARVAASWPTPPALVAEDLLEAALQINTLREAWLRGEGPA
ncbi:MAG: HAD hydrolase-like protein [Planctomycetes bacterium]|nr:HAD hydrolase-like protein [Planctomycetota bacterium]